MKKETTTEYSFILEKLNSGLIKTYGNSFGTPDGDGMEVKQLLDKLPQGYKIKVIVTVVE